MDTLPTTFSPLQKRVANFLAQGLKPAQISSVVGVTPGRISQIIKEPGFEVLLASALEAQQATPEETATAALLTSRYLALENTLLENLTNNAHAMEPRDQIKALEVCQRRGANLASKYQAPGQSPQPTTVVQILVAKHAIPEYQVNADNEIISVDGRPMAPATGAAVKELFAAKRKISEPTSTEQELISYASISEAIAGSGSAEGPGADF